VSFSFVCDSSIDEAISGFADVGSADVNEIDEFECWKKYEPKWTKEQYLEKGNPVKYWIKLWQKYPNLAQFAIDIMTIPASSCDCEQMFSKLGNLLEPKRWAIGSELLAAVQLVRLWSKAEFNQPLDGLDHNVTDEQLIKEYHVCERETLTD
jgi:hypothetical protein